MGTATPWILDRHALDIRGERLGEGYVVLRRSARVRKYEQLRHRTGHSARLPLPGRLIVGAELLIAVNPEHDSRLPFLLRIPLAGGDLVFRTSGTWPRLNALFCHPVTLDCACGP